MIDFARDNPQASLEQRARVARFQQFRHMFRNRHKKAFALMSARLPRGMRQAVYISVNLPGLISRKCSDFLFGESPFFESKADSDSEPLRDLVDGLDLGSKLYEGGLSQSWRGETVLRVRVYEGKLMLDEVSAEYYYTETPPGNSRQILSQALAWPVKIRDKEYLRVEHHEPGRIINEAFRLKADGKVAFQVALSELGEDTIEVVDTRVDAPLIWHVVNYREGTEWAGISDYEDPLPIFDAINNRLSSIDRILGRHANPKLVAPGGFQQETLDSNKDLFLVDPGADSANLPRYLTWDGALQAAFEELDRLLEMAYQLGEMAPALWGLDKAGQVESGKALRLRFIPTEHKINRKKRYWSPVVPRLLQVASQLGAVNGVQGVTALSEPPLMIWQDGLPKIFSELAEDVTKLHAEGLISKHRAVQMLYDLDDEEAAAEVAWMRQEAQESSQMMMESFENGGRDNQEELGEG